MALTFNWSTARSFLAEGLCTALFSYAVYSVVTGISIINEPGSQMICVCLAITLSSIGVIYSFMDITIAHFNPAITLAAVVTGKLPVGMGIGYIVMQHLGAMAASALMLLCKPGASSVLLGETRSTIYPDATRWNAVITETILTGILTYIVFSVAINVFNPPTQVKIEIPDEVDNEDKFRVVTSQAPNRSAFAPIAIGYTLGFLSLLGLGSSGGVFNPAISFAPALFSGVWTNIWVYFLGQYIGGVIGGLLHIFVFAKSI